VEGFDLIMNQEKKKFVEKIFDHRYQKILGSFALLKKETKF